MKTRILLATLLPFLLAGCVHKSLIEGNTPVDPEPPVPGQDLVHVYVDWTNVSHPDLFDKGTFVLSNMYAMRGGDRVQLPFAASASDSHLVGEVLSYGHCPEGESCMHSLTLYVRTTEGKLLLKTLDVSAQMRAQRSSRNIYLQISDGMDLGSDQGVTPPVTGEDGAVHVFVRCLNVRGTDQLSDMAFTLSNLYGNKDRETMTLPFAGAVVDGQVAGDILCYGHCADGVSCEHVLTLLLTGTDGTQRLLEFDVSEQMRRQKDASVVFILVSDEPAPKEGVDIFVRCTQVRYSDRIEDGVFTLSNLYAEEKGEKVSLPFPAYKENSTLAGHVFSYGRCRADEPCEHTLSLLVSFKDGGQGIWQIDVSDQMEAQRDADKIYIVITDEIVPETAVDYSVNPGGGITPLQPGETHDVS